MQAYQKHCPLHINIKTWIYSEGLTYTYNMILSWFPAEVIQSWILIDWWFRPTVRRQNNKIIIAGVKYTPDCLQYIVDTQSGTVHSVILQGTLQQLRININHNGKLQEKSKTKFYW